MVEITMSSKTLTREITAEDPKRTNRVAVIWSNMLALIKLRQKGSTKVSKLPSGVFRCILEYKLPNEFCYRYSELIKPIQE